MNLKPFHNFVILSAIESAAGLIVTPDQFKARPTQGVVLGVGSSVSPDIRVGAAVMFDSQATVDFNMADGRKLLLTQDKSIICEVTP